MPLTVGTLVGAVTQRCGIPLARVATELSRMVKVGAIDPAFAPATTPPTASNPGPLLNDAVATALEEFGVPPADRAAVTDGDLLPIGPELQGRFLDRVEIRALESALYQLAVTPRSVSFSNHSISFDNNLIQQLTLLIGNLYDRYQARYARAGVPAAGSMDPASLRMLDPAPFLPWPGAPRDWYR